MLFYPYLTKCSQNRAFWFLFVPFTLRRVDKLCNATSQTSSPWQLIKFSVLALLFYLHCFGIRFSEAFLLLEAMFCLKKFPRLFFTGRPSSGISLEPRPYSARYLGRSGSPRFSQNAVGPLNRLRPGSESSGERSPGVKIPAVEVSFC